VEPDRLTPSQNYWLIEMLSTVKSENPLYADAMKLKAELSKQPVLLYTYVPGQQEDKKLPENRTLKIMNWNVCFFGDLVPMLFGGVRPYVDRVDAVVRTIINSDADIVCLQEIFSLKGGDALVEKLKPHYAHFYTKIGPRVIGFSNENQGIPSGLFVASRYPLKNVEFVPFTAEQTPSNRAYGVFAADICTEQESLARLLATHLQPGSSTEDIAYRAKQMTVVRSNMEQSQLNAFACGDFNIEETSPEGREQLKGFVMNKTPGWTCRELRNYWFQADQNIALFNAQPMDLETIDFFVAKFKADPAPIFKTEIGIVNEINNPGKALSDHQYEITTVTFPELSE
jgi:exonuclease III